MRKVSPTPARQVDPLHGGSPLAPAITPGFNQKSSKLTKKFVLDELEKEDQTYTHLKQELDKWGQHYISKFFRKEGDVIFYFVLFAPTAAPLFFLHERIDPVILHDILIEDGCRFFKGFLVGEAAVEKDQPPDVQSRHERIKKLAVMLVIGGEEVAKFIQDNKNKPFMITPIKEDIAIAQQQYQKLQAIEKQLP